MRILVLGDVRRGGLLALAAAILFGLSTPAAKLVAAQVHPLMSAGLLYLGSGVGLTLFALVRRQAGVRLARADLPWLAGTVLFGGLVGPALLMAGLQRTTGSAAALLLTLEGVFTATLAWIAFREPFNLRVGTGMLAIFAGSGLLAAIGDPGHASLLGAAAVAGACLAWGVDNNLTQRISHVDAVTLTAIKGLVAGVVNVGLALAAGGAVPNLGAAAGTAFIGLFGYGVSLILFVLALREIGAARAGAYFSTAPFIGAAVAVVLLREPVTWPVLGAGSLMALGVWLHLTEPAPVAAS